MFSRFHIDCRTVRYGVGLIFFILLAAGIAPEFRASTHPEWLQQWLRRGLTSNEYEILLELSDYWYTRVTYPTGRFDQRWLLDAAIEDARIPRLIPGGSKTYRRESAGAVELDANGFTSLGPRPLNSDTCQKPCFSFGNVSGRVNTIAVDPVETNVAYFGSDGGGVWKTTNCCTALTTWTPVTDDPLLSTIAIGDLYIDPNDHNTVYAGTGDLRFGSFSFGSTGVLRSRDQGNSWEILGADVFTAYYPQSPGTFPQYQAIGKVRTDPRNSDTLIVGTKTGVFFSYDDGVNWTGPCFTNAHTGQRQDITGLLAKDTGSTTILYAAVGARGFATTVQSNLGENGANGIYSATVPLSGCPAWTLLTRADNGWPQGTGSGVPFLQGGNKVGRIDVAMAPSDPNVMYAQVQAVEVQNGCGLLALGSAPGCQLGLWRTTDGGTTWEQRSGPEDLGGCGFNYNQNWYDQGLAVDPNDPNVVFMDTYDIWKSTDGGASFTDITCGYSTGLAKAVVHVDQHALAFVGNSSSTLLAGSDGGMYLTLNANVPSPVFVSLNDTISTLEFYSGDISANFANASSAAATGGLQDNGSSTAEWPLGDPSETAWSMRFGGDGLYSRLEPKQGQRYYHETPGGALVVSTSGPQGPYTGASGGWSSDDRKSFIFPYEMDKHNCPGATCDHMIAGSFRVWETITGGTTGSSWYPNSPDLTKGTLADRSFINQLAYAYSTNANAIAGTNDGNVWIGLGMGTGNANSANWKNVTGNNAVLPNRPILDVVFDPGNPLIGYAAVGGFDQNTPSTPGHVYQVTCTANCASFTWVNKSGNLPNIPADSIMTNPNFPQQVFVGTDWGLYFTDNIHANPPYWSRFQQGLPNAMIWDMAIDRGATTLAVFTRSRGVFAWPLPNGPVGLPTETPTPTRTPTKTNTPGGPTLTHTPTPTRTNTPTLTVTPGGPTFTPTATLTLPSGTIIQDDSTSVQYNGWRGVQDGNSSGSSYRVSNNGNNFVRFVFNGDKLTWLTRMDPDQGKARVVIDNVDKGVIDLYREQTRHKVRKTFKNLGDGKHHVKIIVLDEKNPNSSDTNVVVDAFRVGNSLIEETHVRVRYSAWVGIANSAASDGTYRRSSNPSSRARLTFIGTAIDFITAKGPRYGKVNVFIDGSEVAHEIDLYDPTPQWQVEYHFDGLTPGQHTIEIRPANAKNDASAGKGVIVDAFRVTNLPPP